MTSFLSQRLPDRLVHTGAVIRARMDEYSVLAFGFLLLANLVRIIALDLDAELSRVADWLLVAVVLGIGLMLAGARIPKESRPVALCFLILLGIYAAGLALNFSYQGLRHIFAILASGIIYLFCYAYGPRLLRSKHFLPLLAAALSVLLLHYTQILPRIWALNRVNNLHFTSTIMSGILTCLTLTIGMTLIFRSKGRVRQHLWALLIFAVTAVLGLIFGLRALAVCTFLAFPMYGLFFHALRRRLAGIMLAVCSLAALLVIILFMGTSHLDSLLVEVDRLARGYGGGRILNGREVLWNKAIDGIEAAPWAGHGAGTTIRNLKLKTRDRNKTTLSDKPDIPARPISHTLGGLGNLHTNYNIEPKSAHNLFLQIGIQTGLPGMAALVALCLLLVANLRSRNGERVQPLQCYVAAGTFMMICLSVFEVFLIQNILSWGVFAWIFMGIGAGLVNAGRGKLH